ncbi:MAG: sortase [Niabella sp.]|nr:MAG: sortase [Niabella sp.]
MYFRLFLRVTSNFLIATGVGIMFFTYSPIVYDNANYLLFHTKTASGIVTTNGVENISNVVSDSENISPIKAASDEFAVIIPSIDVNAPVVENVSTSNEKEYMQSLRSGVAHARGSALPGQNGNMFLFAHSSLNFWELGPYATVFNLLEKTKNDDTVIIVYKSNVYIYEIFDQEVVKGWDTSPFYEEYDTPVVTLITCTPPGTTLNRLVVRAKLVREL